MFDYLILFCINNQATALVIGTIFSLMASFLLFPLAISNGQRHWISFFGKVSLFSRFFVSTIIVVLGSGIFIVASMAGQHGIDVLKVDHQVTMQQYHSGKPFTPPIGQQ